MSEENGNNPFYQLFKSTEGENNAQPSSDVSSQESNIPELNVSEEVNRIAEDVFGISLQKDNVSLKTGRMGHLVYMADIEGTSANEGIDILKFAVFERILLNDPLKHLVTSKVARHKNERLDNYVVQGDSILYLFECFKRLNNLIKIESNNLSKTTLETLRACTVENVATALRKPSLFETQNIYRQVCQQLLFYLMN